MVYLLPKSPIQLISPTLEQWDHTVRENYQLYQTEIDRTTYALQRSQIGYGPFGSWLYPAFNQADIQNLQIYKVKQQLGQILPSEVDQFKTINPNIAEELNKCFSAKWNLPSNVDLGVTVALQACAQVFNFQFSWRLAFLVGPFAIHSIYKMGTNNSAVPTLEFMSYLIQLRSSKSRLERSTIDSQLLQDYRTVTKGVEKPLQDLYQDMIDIASTQQPNL